MLESATRFLLLHSNLSQIKSSNGLHFFRSIVTTSIHPLFHLLLFLNGPSIELGTLRITEDPTAMDYHIKLRAFTFIVLHWVINSYKQSNLPHNVHRRVFYISFLILPCHHGIKVHSSLILEDSFALERKIVRRQRNF